ncbi:MAG: hypothetical protein IKZ82_01155 [Clostridia bacterium]|nr:hypothetical protein [Clostridia bacterium]
MKRLPKIILSVMALALLALCAASCSFFQVRDSHSPKSRVIDFVLENENRLIEHIREKSLAELENTGIIEDVYEHEDYIEFSCGGSGFGSNTSYWGFYYALSDDESKALAAISGCACSELTECGDGLEWREENGDNYFYAENITGRFYYYFTSY